MASDDVLREAICEMAQKKPDTGEWAEHLLGLLRDHDKAARARSADMEARIRALADEWDDYGKRTIANHERRDSPRSRDRVTEGYSARRHAKRLRALLDAAPAGGAE